MAIVGLRSGLKKSSIKREENNNSSTVRKIT